MSTIPELPPSPSAEPAAVAVEQAGSVAPLIDTNDIGTDIVPSIQNKICRPFWWRVGKFLFWSVPRTLFGIASLILLLAVLAAIPGLNFLVLGYLLAAEGNIARTGRWRDAVPLIDLAPRLGSIALGFWLWLWPLRLMVDAAADAHIIDPGSPADRGWHLAVRITAVCLTIHLCLALARGGSLFCFFRPLKNLLWFVRQLRDGSYWPLAETRVREFVRGLRLKYHFWLGVRGFMGALLWLVIPTAIFAAPRRSEGGILIFVGGLLLMLVLSWTPFLQAHFAREERFSAFFELRTVRRLYRHAPFAWNFTLLVTLTLALPLYLFKVVLPPRDAMWLETTVFLVSIYPARVLTGWAYYRAATCETPAWFGWRWITRLALLPLLALFVFLLFFTQFIGEHGKRVLFEHHAFLLPAPF